MPRKGPVPPDKIIHGTNGGYNAGCRCDCCRDAHRAYHRADMRKRSGRTLRLVGPETLTERISLDLTTDDLDEWTTRAESAGLSRQAYIRRAVNESIEVEQALERQRERELATPLLDHGG